MAPSTACEERSLADEPLFGEAAVEVTDSLRALGLDLGSRRIGVALSDSAGMHATPYEVVNRSGDERRDHERILQLAEEAGAVVLVVGVPYSLDGAVGPAARAALDEVARLAAVAGRPVETVDERLTTVSAHQSLRRQGVDGRRRRGVVDQVAASVLLQAWLDAHAPREGRRSDP